MPRSLEATPDEESSKVPPAHEVLKNFTRSKKKAQPLRASSPTGRVSFEEYTALTRDHPPKFNEEEVNYREAEGEEKCSGCLHFYTGEVAGRNVCEILRPEGESIEPDYVCRFTTTDGQTYPLLEKKK